MQHLLLYARFASRVTVRSNLICAKIGAGMGRNMDYKTFCISRNVIYNEYKIEDGPINKFYELKNPEREAVIAIPDGCIDLQIVLDQCRYKSFLCSSHKAGNITVTGDFTYCFGIKFNPGMTPACVGLPKQSTAGSRRELPELLRTLQMEDILPALTHFEDWVEFMQRNIDLKRKQTQKHVLVTYIVKEINQSFGNLPINELVERTGYSHCYVDRMFKEMVGLSLKKYADIIRMQNSIHMLEKKESEDLLELLGYYDQSHFIKAFKAFTMVTPNTFKVASKDKLRFV